MTAIKKGHSETPEAINSRIQSKFDQVFSGSEKKVGETTGTSNLLMVTDSSPNISESEMSSSANKKEDVDSDVIDLDFSFDDGLDEVKSGSSQLVNTSSSSAPKTVSSDEGELDFSLDFDSVDEIVQEKMDTLQSHEQSADELKMNFDIDDEAMGMDLENPSSEFEENTQKTIVIKPGTLSTVDLKSFSLEQEGSQASADQTTSDHMTTEEARSNIESTIIGIISPKADAGTGEIDYSKISNQDKTGDFSLDQLSLDDGGDEFTLEVGANTQQAENGATGEFFIDPLATDEPSMELESSIVDVDIDEPNNIEILSAPVKEEITQLKTPIKEANINLVETPKAEGFSRTEMRNDEDSIRVHATIRQLREEREELLGQIKHLKSEQKELEQDNLSLKAGLDEAKIEISILRKRHMVEMEDLKYRLTLSEEKKALAEEKSRQSELRREKLEQKVRIDYNQVKLREKELESKLEMLSMDIDSQVHGRDHKILELRRKIDALEFNMENASIKEQRSNEDRRKLEDKLNKIMKTLRNSIKNLEEDIDLVQEDIAGTEKN